MGNGVHEEECLLLRPLEAGEYIIAADELDGNRLGLATRVMDPTPQKLALSYTTEGALRLGWQSVPGAEHYRIYASDDAEEYFDTGLRVEGTEILMAPPGEQRQFFYVTAEK